MYFPNIAETSQEKLRKLCFYLQTSKVAWKFNISNYFPTTKKVIVPPYLHRQRSLINTRDLYEKDLPELDGNINSKTDRLHQSTKYSIDPLSLIFHAPNYDKIVTSYLPRVSTTINKRRIHHTTTAYLPPCSHVSAPWR